MNYPKLELDKQQIRLKHGAANWLKLAALTGVARFRQKNTIEFRYQWVKDKFVQWFVEKVH